MAALTRCCRRRRKIRRRQITQSTGNGGGNGNARDRISPNLFDRELKRQQRTNYETKAQVETTPDQQEQKSSALDKIRDSRRRGRKNWRGQQQELAKSNLAARRCGGSSRS
jgi:hypothetical protein